MEDKHLDHLLDLFFSQGEMMNSMTWEFFIDQIHQYLSKSPTDFNELLVKFIKNLCQKTRVSHIKNTTGLLRVINENIKLFLNEDPHNSEEKNRFTTLFTALKFFHTVIEITLFTSEGIELHLIQSDDNDFSSFIQLSLEFITKSELKKKRISLIEELINIINIISFSACGKSTMRQLLTKFMKDHEGELFMMEFLNRLLFIVSRNNDYQDYGWSSYIYDGAKLITSYLSLGIIGGSSREITLSSIGRQASFLLCHLIYCSSEHGNSALIYLENLSLMNNLFVYAPEGQQKDDSNSQISSEGSNANYVDLFNLLVRFIGTDIICLLFYAFLRNSPAISYKFIESPFGDCMALNLASLIYKCEVLNHYGYCMVLIILLMLTCNQKFVEFLHAKNAPQLSWLHEQYRSTDWNVANVLLFTLLKGIKYNHFTKKDEFSQENFIGNLMNLSNGGVRLNNEVSFSLINYLKLCLIEYENCISTEPSDNAGKKIEFLKRTIGCLLQFINFVLSNKLTENPDLIHHLLLFKQNSPDMDFSSLEDEFHEEITNITTLTKYYQFKFTKLVEIEGPINPIYVLDHIKKFTNSASIIISYSKDQSLYEFHEDSTSPLFFLSYLRLLYENECVLLQNS